MKKNKTILLIINDSWGEVDWILPVMHYLKNQWDPKIIVYFNSDEVYYEKDENYDLYLILNQISSDIFTPSRLLSQARDEKDNFQTNKKHLKRE